MFLRASLRLLVLVLATSTVALPARAQLAGTYTIGGASPDYAGIPAAVTDLVAQGVSGNVIFQIRPGTYSPTNGITIGPIPGVSASAQVRFEAADPANRPLLRRPSATAGSNFVIRLDGADWVTLRNLDIEAAAPAPVGRLIVLDGDASNVTIRGCTLTGHVPPGTVVGSDVGSLVWSPHLESHNALTVDQNTFNYGWIGVEADANRWDASDGLVVTDNTFSGQEIAGITIHGDGRVEGNTFTDAPTSSVQYRAIVTAGGEGSAMAVVGNTIEVRTGASGVAGNAGTTLIANNLVSIRVSHPWSGGGVGSTAGGGWWPTTPCASSRVGRRSRSPREGLPLRSATTF